MGVGGGGVGSAVHDGLLKGLGTEVSGAALTVAVDVVQAWAVVLTLGFTVILLFFLAFCICSRKDDSYDDYDDYEGVRTVRVYHHPHDGGENGLLTDQTSQASSRGTVKRELPAIPSSGSTTLTQTLTEAPTEAPQQGGPPCRPVGGVQVLPSTAAPPFSTKSRVAHSPPPSEVGPSSSSTVSSELATRHPSHSSFGSGPAREHQYAHLQSTKEEHPYAKVGGDIDTDNYDEPRAVVAARTPVSEQVQKAAPSDSLVLSQSHPRSPSLEIQASSAIAGHTPANEELPYITPKITQPSGVGSSSRSPAAAVGLSQLGEGFAAATSPTEPLVPQPPPTQPDRSPDTGGGGQHFSGDSQDSRGYTSISVREPLAALKAGHPTAVPSRLQHNEGQVLKDYNRLLDPNKVAVPAYYMTVSDDSADETYACIYERSGGATQTYAQIQPTSSGPSPAAPPPSSPGPPPSHLPLSSPHSTALPPSGGQTSPSPLPEPGSPDPPAPPSVDSLKHVLHSRQASSGSTSGVGVVSSPGCEKRVGAGSRGSPLPPLPQGDQHYYEATPPPPPSATSPPHSAMWTALDMLTCPGSPHKSPVPSAPHSPPLVGGDRPDPRALEDMYAKVMKKRGSTDAMSQERPMEGSRPAWNIVGVATGPAPHHVPSDPGYETVKDFPEQNYPAYETVKNGRENDSEPGYETVTGGSKLQREEEDDPSEPGYETVANRSGASEAAEPGYETVRGGNRMSDSEPGYETVSSSRGNDQSSDPGYETVSSRQDDSQPEHGYEQLRSNPQRPPSECDSNYEQLKFNEQPDPGYESVPSRVEEHFVVHQTQQPMYSEIDKPQPVYASVKKKPQEDKRSVGIEEPFESEKLCSLRREDAVNGDSEDDMLDEEETNDVMPVKRYKRSIEEEAAILVSTVEESAINILSSREKLGSLTDTATIAVSSSMLEDGGSLQVASSDGSDTSSDAVFSRKLAYEQPSTLPGLVSVAGQDPPLEQHSTLIGLVSVAGQEPPLEVVNESMQPPQDFASVNGDSETTSYLTKKDSGSVETDNGGRDTNKASIEVHNGSAHSSVDNSSSGREDISPEDEVSLPPPGASYYESESQEPVGGSSAATTATHQEVRRVSSSLNVDDENSAAEEVPLTPTVLSIPVPQSFFPRPDDTSADITSVSPPHAMLLITNEDDLPEPDQQSVVLPPPPVSDYQQPPPAPLPPPLMEDYGMGSVPPPPDLLSDAPECDLPPPLEAGGLVISEDLPSLGAADLPPPLEEGSNLGEELTGGEQEDPLPPPVTTQDLPPPLEDSGAFVISSGVLENDDGAECDHPPPPPVFMQDLPPPLMPVEDGVTYENDDDAKDEQQPPPPPVLSAAPSLLDEDESAGITVTVNPMAEIDELASRVAKACRDDDDDDVSPVKSPSRDVAGMLSNAPDASEESSKV